MKYFLKISLILIVSIFLIYSCSEEQEESFQTIDKEIAQIDYNSDGVKVVDDVVYFKNAKAFAKTMQALNEKKEKDLENWEIENGFAASYRKVLNGTSKDSLIYLTETDSAFSYIIESPEFATVVNEDGVFVIGDTIHKITYSVEYMIPDLDFSALSAIDLGDITKSAKSNIVTYEITRQKLTPVCLKSAAVTESYIMGSRLLRKNYNTDPLVFMNDEGDLLEKISAHLHAWCNNYSNYSEIGVKIVGRKRGTFGWRNDNMWYAAVSAETTYLQSYSADNYTGVIYEKTYSRSGTNESTVGGNIVTNSGQTYFRCMELNCTYTYQDDYSQTGVWEITWE
ncbi:hypothetical protein [Maribellus maritimus]|uniref:hypothetical protein n=1 Tax=Maribellus maritimus TaxID=2870838 RepID=UPI001EEC2F31|nr:hypothetical protein [Maribellus maritimus]MCG6191413.1 hypothetical protein [Maribellus maritimus]